MAFRRLVLFFTLLAAPQLANGGQLADGLAAIETEDFDAAIEILLPLARAGDPDAQYAVGGLYYRGWGVEQEAATSANWIKNAADQNLTEAKTSLAFLYYYGVGVELDHEKALRWYREAAMEGNTDAQIALSMMLDRGEATTADGKEALHWMRAAADSGDPVAQHNMGIAYGIGYWVPKDSIKAASWLRKSAEQGDIEGQYQTGWMYEQGNGVVQDETEAIKWYKAAWEADYMHAPARDALMAIDKELGERFGGMFEGMYAESCRGEFQEALQRAKQGDPKWQFCVALKYSDGPRTEPDEIPIVDWIAKFPLMGNAQAKYYLGSLNSANIAVTANERQSVYWLEQAAEQDYVDAQTSLGLNHFFGNGTPVDVPKAKHWFRKAIENGDPTATEFWGWLELGELGLDQHAGSFEGNTYFAPNGLFRADYLLSGGRTSIDSFDAESRMGTVSLSNDFGALNGVIYGPASSSTVDDWFHSVPLSLIKSQIPEAKVLRKEIREFHDMAALIAVVEIPEGGLMVKYDIEKDTYQPSDSVRGFVVFSKNDYFFALMCEINIIDYFGQGRRYDPENWDEFLPELSKFYASMEFGEARQ